MRFESIAALLAATAQSVHALSTLSTRMGVATTTVTATSFETATSTITSVAEITSVATTCAVGTTAPTLAQYYLSSCTESVWSSAGQFWQQHCSASLVGGTVIRAYANVVGAYNYPVSFCAALNSLNIPASKCAGINVMRVGGIAEYFLVNGDLSLTSTTNGYTNTAIALYTTNPCEVTATATTTDFYPVAETSAVVYTSTYEITYVETITVSIPDPSISSTSSTSSSAIPLNTTSSAAATTIVYPLANATSTLSFVPVSNTTTSSIVLSTSNTSINASSQTLVPNVINATTTSSIILSTPIISSNVTTQTLVPVAVNASNITVSIAVLPVSNATIINPSSSDYTSTRVSLSSIIPDRTSSVVSTAPNTTVSTLISSSASPSPMFLNTTTTSNIRVTTSSSPIFQNTSSSNSAHMPYLISSASVIIAVPALSTSASAQMISASPSNHGSQAPVTLTRYITYVYTVTACPPEVTNCPASQKSTFLATKTIVTYLTVQAASPTHVAQSSDVHALMSGFAMETALSNTIYTTSTLYSTFTQTVRACPSSVKDCPASEKTAYQTEVVKAYTTICPVAASLSDTISRATSSIVAVSEVSPTSSDISSTRYNTSTLYSTSTQTVTACPSSVKDCPASEKTVYQTEVIKAYTTVCPVAASSSQGGLQATSSIVSPFEASPSSIAPSSGSVADATHTQSNPVAVAGALSGSSILSSKIISGSESVAFPTVGGTRTYTADIKTMTSTRGFAASVAPSAPSSSATTEAVASTLESSSSIIALVLSYSGSSAVSGYSPAVHSQSLNATTIVMPNKNSTAVAVATSTAKSSAATSAVTSPFIALYTGAASASKPHSVSLILGAVFASLGLFFSTFQIT